MTKRPPWVSIIHIPREQIRSFLALIRSLACFLKVPQPLSLDWIWGVGSSSATRGIGALSCVEGNNGSSIFHEDDLAGSGLKAPSTEDHEQSWRSLIETRGCQRSVHCRWLARALLSGLWPVHDQDPIKAKRRVRWKLPCRVGWVSSFWWEGIGMWMEGVPTIGLVDDDPQLPNQAIDLRLCCKWIR